MTAGGQAATQAERAATLSGARIIDALRAAQISHVVSVPDLTTSEGVLRPLSTDPSIRLIRVCREEEGVGICAGLAVAGRRPAMLIQYTGLYASMNAIRAIALEYRQPICMLVGLLFADSPDDPTRSRNVGVSRLIPVLRALELPFIVVPDDSRTPLIAPMLNEALAAPAPAVVLISRYPE